MICVCTAAIVSVHSESCKSQPVDQRVLGAPCTRPPFMCMRINVTVHVNYRSRVKLCVGESQLRGTHKFALQR